jgi:hypothetical protein
MLVMYLCNDDITTTTPGGRLPRGHINININIKAPRLLSGLPLSLRSAVNERTHLRKMSMNTHIDILLRVHAEESRALGVSGFTLPPNNQPVRI